MHPIVSPSLFRRPRPLHGTGRTPRPDEQPRARPPPPAPGPSGGALRARAGGDVRDQGRQGPHLGLLLRRRRLRAPPPFDVGPGRPVTARIPRQGAEFCIWAHLLVGRGSSDDEQAEGGLALAGRARRLSSGAGTVSPRNALVAASFDVDGPRVDVGDGAGQASTGLRARGQDPRVRRRCHRTLPAQVTAPRRPPA